VVCPSGQNGHMGSDLLLPLLTDAVDKGVESGAER
jgi:hypothetical protein